MPRKLLQLPSKNKKAEIKGGGRQREEKAEIRLLSLLLLQEKPKLYKNKDPGK